MKKEQLELGPDIKLKPITLPDTRLDLVEQFAFALQNRDAIGLRQLIAANDKHEKWGDREGFISKFIGFCDKMEKKHGSIYVHTVPGQCGRERCNKGTGGLGVTVNTINDNKLSWGFNLVIKMNRQETLHIWLCQQFKVKSDEIPF